MLITILEGREVTTDRNSFLVEILPGSTFNAISREYLTYNPVILNPWGLWCPRDSTIPESSYIIYLHGYFIAIPRAVCHVPKSIGWYSND